MAHDGSLGNALAYIDAIAAAGADAVKFQNHALDPCNRFRPGTFFPQDADRQAYYQRTMFSPGGWQMLYNRAKLRGIEFGCSVWSADTVGWLHPFVDFWKVPSGEFWNEHLQRAMIATRKPVVLSTGMSTLEEISKLAAWYSEQKASLTILQCTTAYPCPPERVGLNLIEDDLSDDPKDSIRNCGGRYWVADKVRCGLSDHSGRIAPGICAAWMGADMLEVHVCWSKQQWGPDVPASLTIDELALLVRECRFAEKMRANPVDKDALAASAEIKAMREVFVHG